MSGTRADQRPDQANFVGGSSLASVNRFADRLTLVLIFLSPVLLLWVRGGANVCFAILLLITFYRLALPNSAILRRGFDRADMLFGAAMVSLVVVTLLSQIYHQKFTLGPYDSVLRFLYVIPVYVLLRHTDFSQVSILQYGVLIGALLSPLVPWLIPGDPAHWGTVRASSYFLSPIHYGELALILGFLALFSINWLGKDRPPLIVLKVAAFGAGVVASVLTGSRGGWVAIPILLFLWLYLSLRGKLLLSAGLTLLAVAIIAVAIMYVSPLVNERLGTLLGDLTPYQDGHFSRSTRERLQMWNVAIVVTLRESPLFGLGPDEFGRRVMMLAQEGLVSQELAAVAASELHSELVAKFASLGLLGLTSIVAIYFVPLALFVQAMKSDSELSRGAARLGLCFVVGFFVFGLTVETFNLKMIATFYSFMVAVLLAGALHRDPEARTVSVAPAAAR